MNDPWDVKSVRHAGQYVSCMKINGVPILPPLLSKECRKEMQYYKVLAKEVEKRISILKTYVTSDSDSNEDKPDAPELPLTEQQYILPPEDLNSSLTDKYLPTKSPIALEDISPRIISPVSQHMLLDLNYSANNLHEISTNSQKAPIDLPERDCDSPKIQKELITEMEYTKARDTKSSPNRDKSFKHLSELPATSDGPSSLTSKNFTGSLNDLHTESVKQISQLTRQRSYTLLQPGPQLMAHLENQSQSTGVEIASISMSESLSNLSSPVKKRRSWDLDSAKVKWSSMALELKQKNLPENKTNGVKNHTSRTAVRKSMNTTPSRARSQAQDRGRRASVPVKTVCVSEPITKNKKSPNSNANVSQQKTPKTSSPKKENTTPNVKKEPVSVTNSQSIEVVPDTPKQSAPVPEADDPAARVRELYEKIQKQQLIQMANLVEKQKREQLMLQQVFEEQNNMLFKQLKTICPKSPVEIKEAWPDNNSEPRGPVSLSQLINPKSPDIHTSTLTDTNNYINQCDNVLKKSRHLTSSMKKHSEVHSPSQRSDINLEGSITRTHTPTNRHTSRKLNYDTSSTERDIEPIMTDRTNDTLADINTTFSSDQSDVSFNNNNNTVLVAGVATKHQKDQDPQSATKAAKYSEMSISAMKNICMRSPKQSWMTGPPTAKEITAACYSLHDTFVASSAAERCGVLAADRARRRSLAARHPRAPSTDVMSQSHTGAFPSRPKRPSSASLMTQSNYETFSGNKYVWSARRRPWR